MNEKIKEITGLVLVTDDMGAALSNWADLCGVGEDKLSRFEDESAYYTRFRYGGVDMTLVEPKDKAADNIYANTLRKQGPGFCYIEAEAEGLSGLVDLQEATGLMVNCK